MVLGADVIGESIFAPVFDEQLLVAASEFPDRKGQPVLQAFDRRDLVARAAAAQDFERNFLSRRAPYRFDSLIRGKEDKLPARRSLARRPIGRLRRGAGRQSGFGRTSARWTEGLNWKTGRLSALNRSSGQTVWTIDLPCRPAWNGLSIAGDGSILASLWDGSIACFGAAR